MKYVRRLNLAAPALVFAKVRPWRMLLLALVVGGAALFGSRADTDATHGAPGTRAWGYEAAANASRILEYDIGADSGPISSCVPAGSVNGRGIAFDPVDGNLWYTFIDPADGFIHKTTPPPTCTPVDVIPGGGVDALQFIDGLGGTYQDDVGALDVDPDDNNIWAAGYLQRPGDLSFLYKIDSTNGNLITSCSVPVGGGHANDTLAVAKIAGLGGSGKYLLTDADEVGVVLHVIDAAACVGGLPVTPLDVTLPVGVTGIDYEAIDVSGAADLIATDLQNIYDLEKYPFSTVTDVMSTPLPNGLEDITLVPAEEPGSITICKKTDPAGGGPFTFGWSAPLIRTMPFTLNDGPPCFTISAGPSGGPYSFAELPPLPPGWQLVNIVCTGGVAGTFTFNPSVNAMFTSGDTGVTIDLWPGENVTCTFFDCLNDKNGDTIVDPCFTSIAVGGIAEPVTLNADASAGSAGGSGSPEVPYAALAGTVAAAAALAIAGGWYARRRLLR